MKNSFNVVLIEPEIPQNTGNIVRLCACTNSNLFIVGRIGFSMSDKYLKRSGLDYWDDVNIVRIDTFDDLKEKYNESNFYFFTTKSQNIYSQTKFYPNDFFVFGPETRGIDESLLEQNKEYALNIPMKENKRSLNLSNSVAIVVYEALRQNGFN